MSFLPGKCSAIKIKLNKIRQLHQNFTSGPISTTLHLLLLLCQQKPRSDQMCQLKEFSSLHIISVSPSKAKQDKDPFSQHSYHQFTGSSQLCHVKERMREDTSLLVYIKGRKLYFQQEVFPLFLAGLGFFFFLNTYFT